LYTAHHRRYGMKRLAIATTIVLCLLLAFSAGLAAAITIGDIELGLGIGAPPPVEFGGPPELVPIPGRYVYFAPDIDTDFFFYHGQWYRPHKGRWFRSEHYTGPWEHVREVPPALTDLPGDYRTTTPGYYRVPYGELRNNWERWEREKYWDRRAQDREMREREREREELGRGVPPPVEFEGPPELVAIPGRYAYFAPDIDTDLFFYHGRWYRPHKGRWFRSEHYTGPWEHVREVPPALIDLPRDYRTVQRGYSRVPYGELRNNWERWEREKYWDRRAQDREMRESEREREERDMRRERERDRWEERDVQPEREKYRY
jgi:hypothetical protein